MAVFAKCQKCGEFVELVTDDQGRLLCQSCGAVYAEAPAAPLPDYGLF